ncbi:MAG: IS200/IS605 family transposase [Planctomycetota bacterium]|nr:IS200/IS605 family transposase [Planctomycetota bacterium]
MPQSYGAIYFHLVFSTKNRQQWIDEKLEARLHEYLGGTLRAMECRLLAAGGTADHIHLLVSITRTLSIANVMRDIKSNSSGWIHKEIEGLAGFGWQDGYGAFSVSFSQIDKVKNYIGRQKEHHRKASFQDELLELLDRHEVSYDPKYVLE